MTSTMSRRTHTVGPKGQVVIPKAIRDELGLQPGDPVDFVVDNGAVRITLHRGGSLLGILKDTGMLERYMAEKAIDRAKEDGPRW